MQKHQPKIPFELFLSQPAWQVAVSISAFVLSPSELGSELDELSSILTTSLETTHD